MSDGDDLRADIQRAFAQVETAKSQQQELAPKVEQPIPAATVRFVVTKWVLLCFLGYASVVGGFIMYKGESAQTAQLIDIMKTLLLPLVTLVIGFYFGSKEAA